MLLRALVVLLVILNFGVAVWWALRGAAGDAAAMVDPGPATLTLVGEAPSQPEAQVAEPVERAEADDEPASDEVALATTPLQPATPPQCVALGPFAEAASRDAVIDAIAPAVVRVASRDVGETPRGWRVHMAPLADRASADAMVARLLEAGFNDYYVIAEGADANGIALGRFGSEAPARARAEALRAAGFEADAEPLGSVLVRHWADAMLAEGDTAEALRARAAVARAEPRDCNVQWEAG